MGRILLQSEAGITKCSKLDYVLSQSFQSGAKSKLFRGSAVNILNVNLRD